MNLNELTEPFAKLGAREPESWACSQQSDGIDQVARFLFLREAWKGVVAPDDTMWIERWSESAKKRPNGPCAGAGPALERILAAGATRTDLHEIVRVIQYELLFSLCHLLDDPGSLEPELAGLSWRLVRTNEESEAIGTIDGLHESVLESDPSDREMRPAR